jgi:paraquat-inducible protein B
MTDRRLPAEADLPEAQTARDWKPSLVWIVPLLAAAGVGWLVYRSVIASGPTVTILFKDAEGLEAGKSDVKFRGARIGTVESIELSKDHQLVVVKATFDKSAADLAREGSEFWIVKPTLGAGEVKALTAIVSGNYVALKPGTGGPAKQFQGLSEPPVVSTNESGLKIVFLSAKLGSIERGTSISYRGIQIGRVLDFELAPDSQLVRISAIIDKHFAPLVRMNSVFWNAGGINVNVSLLGAAISANSLQSLIAGGIALATPDNPDKPAPEGTTFRLYEKPEEKWRQWEPIIRLPEK